MSYNIDFDVPSFLPEYISKKLRLLMVFSDEDNTKQWGVYFHKTKFIYQHSKVKKDFNSYFYEFEDKGNELTNNFNKNELVIVIPLDDLSANEFRNLAINRYVQLFDFEKLTYNNNQDFQKVKSRIKNTSSSQNILVKDVNLKELGYLIMLYLEDGEKQYFDFDLQDSLIEVVDSSSISLGEGAILKLNKTDDIFKWEDGAFKNITENINSKNQFETLFKKSITYKNRGIIKFATNELKVYYYKSLHSKNIELLQLNNDIYTKYTTDAQTNLLSEAIAQITKLKDALRETRKSQPFALLPSVTLPNNYTLYAHYKVEQDVATLISTKVDLDEGKFLSIKSLPFDIPDLKAELEVLDYPEVNDKGTFARLIIGKYNFQKDQTIYDGALEFGLGEEAKYSGSPYDHNGKISFVLQRKSTQKPLFLWEWDGKMDDVEIGYSIEDFSIPVKSVKPISQDLTTGEKYLAPSSTEAIVNGYGERLQKQLIIPLSEKQENDYYLCISESVNIGQDFRVDMRLIEVNPKAGADQSKRIKTIVLDSSPQFVGLVDSNFLLQRGYDDGVWVLAQKIQNNLNEGVWEIFDDQSYEEGFNLILPAQTIGEEFIKDKNESIFPLPYKFGAPAILKIAGDKLEKNYVAPPWDLRKLWGAAGDILPGSPLLRAEFELLYGLQADLKPKNTLMAELGARLGDLPVPINNNLAWKATTEQVDSFYQNWINYLKYYRAWKSRLAILETYRANEPEVEATFVAPNMVNEELEYKPRLEFESIKEIQKLREKLEESDILKENSKNENDKKYYESKKQEIRVELEKLEKRRNENFGASLDFPLKQEGRWLDGIKMKDEYIGYSDLHRFDGLKGGFTYGFQDKEIYKSFLQKALTEGSTSAELSGLAFSSQGGFGKQVARFDNDLTAVKSLTTMGRVHRYAVERIGRIGVFWHKAKHVIEYERTVVPSEYEKDNQNHLLGRPMVRKIREYIEILEPEKKYPDFEGHSPKDTGAVNACVFKSTIIPISNSWGRLVYKPKQNPTVADVAVGWEVPLWYEGADETLFPKPQIFFLLEPPKDSNLNHSTAQLAEPQNLMFYTAYRDGAEGAEPGKDVCEWKSVYGVDFTDKPVFDELVLQPYDNRDLNDKNRLDQLMPNAIDVLPGHGRFTFKVEPQLTPAGMANVYQPDSGLSGVMRTVSMQRNGDVTSERHKQKFTTGTGLGLKDISLEKILNFGSELETIRTQFEELVKLNLIELTPAIKHQITPPNANVDSLNLPTKILWFKILQYSDSFVEHWSSLKNKIINETQNVQQVIEREFHLLETYELQYTELLAGLKSLYFLSDIQIKKIENFKKSLNDNLIADNDNSPDNEWFNAIKERILKEFEDFKGDFKSYDDPNLAAIIDSVKSAISSKIESYQLVLTKSKVQVLKEIKEDLGKVDFSTILNLSNTLAEAYSGLLNKINTININIQNIKAQITTKPAELKDIIDSIKVNEQIKNLLAILFPKILKFNEYLNTIEPFKTINDIEKFIETDISIEQAKQKIQEYLSYISSKTTQINNAVNSATDFNTAVNNVLTNYRSVWEEISAPGMGLNRKTIALIVNKVDNAKQIEQQLSITPCIAKYKQFESDLNALGLRLPVTHIFNELKAPTEEWLNNKSEAIRKYFKDIKFNESLPNLSAMDFDGMFKNLPSGDFSKYVKFSQGFDKENLSAWAKANLDYKLPDPDEPMFSISVASVWLSNAHLKADIEASANADGVVTKKEYGELSGDFAIKIGSNSLITFEETKVIFKNGKMDFDLDPSRMKMDGVLKMITDATQNLNQYNNEAKAKEKDENGNTDADKPFKIKILKATIGQLLGKESNEKAVTTDYKTPETDLEKTKEELEKLKKEAEYVAVPYGVKATLDIPAISVGGGTTSMTNLSFGGQFVLRFFNPEQKKLEFITGLGFYIGKREAPFNFTAFIFGGGGFVDTLIYYSADKGTEIDFTMSIHASAGLFFNAGWVSGSVFIYLGLEGRYIYQSGIGSNMIFTLFAQLVGTLNIMGLVSAYMIVRLALSYEDNKMIGRGYISIEIEICWCVTISVSSSFEKQFTGSKKVDRDKQRSSISASLG